MLGRKTQHVVNSEPRVPEPEITFGLPGEYEPASYIRMKNLKHFWMTGCGSCLFFIFLFILVFPLGN